MPAVRVQVTLVTTDNVSENFITNSWAFQGANPFGDAAAITGALGAFYSALGATNLSAAIAQNGHQVKYYDLPGVKPNYPVVTNSFNLSAAPSGTSQPSEVALCLSFQGQRAAGFPQARRRGRVYLGPLSTSTLSGGRPIAAFITTVLTAASAFRTTINALASDTAWAVWSPVNNTAVSVTDGWVDNAFDTQRRRGLTRTVRSTF